MLGFPFFFNEYSVEHFEFKTALNKKRKTRKVSQTKIQET